MRLFFVFFIASLCIATCAADKPQLNAEKDVLLHTSIEKTDVNLFLPAKVSAIKAVLINPADKSAGPGTVWGETVRYLGCAQMGVMLENVDKRNNRPATLKRVIDLALKQFAAESNHPELANVPYLFVGMSKGGGWSAELGQDFGPRTIAFNNVCGWVGKPEKDVSMGGVIIIGGKPDGFKMLDAVPTQYEPARMKSAPWMLALQWGCAHDYGNANALAIPYLEAVFKLRMHSDANAENASIKLSELKLEKGWLGDRSSWESNYATIANYQDFKGIKEQASWLPNKYVAFTWRSFVSKDPPVQLMARSEDGRLVLPGYAPTTKRFLLIKPKTSLVLSASFKSDASVKELRFFDGDILLGSAPAEKPEFIWKDIPEGLHSVYVEFTAQTVGVSNPALIVATLNDAPAQQTK